MQTQTQGKTKYYVLYGLESRLDQIHAERMKGFDFFHLFGVIRYDHNAGIELKEHGLIDELIPKIIELKNPEMISDYLRTKDYLVELVRKN